MPYYYEVIKEIKSFNLSYIWDLEAYLKKELKDWKKNPRTDTNPDGYWLHPEDVAGNVRTVEALNLIISHFAEVPEQA